MGSWIDRIRVTRETVGKTVRGGIVDDAVQTGPLFTLRLDGCLWIAAPLILYRLKRLGYSEVSACCEAGGLTVRFRR